MSNRTRGKDLLTHEKILSFFDVVFEPLGLFLRNNVAIQPVIGWNGVIPNMVKG